MKIKTVPVIRRHRPALVQLHQERARRCEASKQWRRAEYEWSRVIENCGTEEDMEHAVKCRNQCSIHCRATYVTADPRMDFETVVSLEVLS
ncbi:PerC family transcriptional regulator [Hafnia alvei]|uniref:PerC family transcriptional regulator n=1 Tax=Hafnia TaxID=568 RepID=UPI001033ADEE|nr:MULTISPECIES: PerC family transcriptional regulator [Hafnia]MDU3155421.1 PerC family transcriptional regulator [Hafnia alvei]MDU7483918.1 PerC family transcriptional regulator [Hafnia alvei]MEB7888814.1 PerC family transcriptional regulator [Hafnia alvei]QIP56303.1 PerC family transcriptional regulator [Hafnia alvei]TBL91223.1 PerC family transcriptional regulator [Hafnia alvei]